MDPVEKKSTHITTSSGGGIHPKLEIDGIGGIIMVNIWLLYGYDDV